VERGLARVRIHADASAARSAAALGARAYTVGRDVYFARGQFRPETRTGRRLIAHELAHVAQQERAGRPEVQRQPAGVVQMEPLEVRSTLQPTERAISDLSPLRGVGVDPKAMTTQRDEATIARNSPDPSRRLPFTRGGAWKGREIITALGPYDTHPGTDSDAVRCVQAVALASRIADGPVAVTGFLRAMILDGSMSRPRQQRQRTAVEVLEHVIGRIEMEHATFGDLIWAQEALHDLFYNDVGGTPEPEILDRISPALELGRTLVRMDVWANDPAEVMAVASGLGLGEQLVVQEWQVMFNAAFDDLEEKGVHVASGGSTVVSVNGREVRIRRIPGDVRPPPSAIDPVRDQRSGHQILVLRDGATGRLRLYEPEITASGSHLEELRPDGASFRRYFHDLPEVGIYYYLHIVGKLTPGGPASPP
jgi:hypothetical protein